MKACFYAAAAAVTLLMGYSDKSNAQTPKLIKIDAEKMSYKPKQFYIIAVKDKRADTTTIGQIEWPIGKTIAYNYVGGSALAFSNAFRKQIPFDSTKDPIELHLTELKAEKKRLNNKEELYLTIAFDAFHNNTNVYTYKGWVFVPAKFDPAILLAHLSGILFERAFPDMDNFLLENKESLNKTVAVEPFVAKTSLDSDLIMYRKNYLLRPTDYKGIEDSNSKSLETWIDYYYKTEYIVNKKIVRFEIIPYFNTKTSWLRDKSHMQVLNVNQMLFDLAGLKACELYGLIRTTSFSYDGVEKELDLLFRQTEMSLKKTGDQYLEETDYSVNKEKNTEWVRRIRTQLDNCACYN